MKTKLLSSLLLSASLLGFSGNASAQTDPSGTFQAACYPIQHSLRCRLFFDNPEAKPVTIIIRDAKGQKQHEETLYKLAKFNRAYNLAPLGDGTYTFEVSQGKTLYTQDFTVETTHSRQVAMTIKSAPPTRSQAAPILASTSKDRP